MRASDLLHTPVIDTHGRSLGSVHDVHVIQDGPLRASGQAALRVHGLIAGPGALGTRLGYTSREGIPPTSENQGPPPMRGFFRWLQRPRPTSRGPTSKKSPTAAVTLRPTRSFRIEHVDFDQLETTPS